MILGPLRRTQLGRYRDFWSRWNPGFRPSRALALQLIALVPPILFPSGSAGVCRQCLWALFLSSVRVAMPGPVLVGHFAAALGGLAGLALCCPALGAVLPRPAGALGGIRWSILVGGSAPTPWRLSSRPCGRTTSRPVCALAETPSALVGRLVHWVGRRGGAPLGGGAVDLGRGLRENAPIV